MHDREADPLLRSPWYFLFAGWACANSLSTHTFRIAKTFLLRCVRTCARTTCTRTQSACPSHVAKISRIEFAQSRARHDCFRDQLNAELSSSGKMRCIAGLREAAGCASEPAQTSPKAFVIDTPFGIGAVRRERCRDGSRTNQMQELCQSPFLHLIRSTFPVRGYCPPATLVRVQRRSERYLRRPH